MGSWMKARYVSSIRLLSSTVLLEERNAWSKARARCALMSLCRDIRTAFAFGYIPVQVGQSHGMETNLAITLSQGLRAIRSIVRVCMRTVLA